MDLVPQPRDLSEPHLLVVVDLIERIRRRSPNIRVSELGRTSEGKSIPLVILSNSPVKTASQAAQSGKPIVFVMAEATADIGRPGRLSGLDSWYDGATFTRLGGTPSIAYGPEGFLPDGRSVAHTIDEQVPVDGLIACAKGLAVAAMRFCGVV